MSFNPLMVLGLFILCISASYATEIDTAQRSKQLTPAAQQLIVKGEIDLNALLRNESNDLIVEYVAGNQVYANDHIQRQALAQLKSTFIQDYKASGKVQILRDYNGLAMTVYRVQDRDVLIKLLNDTRVKAVYPNRRNQRMLLQSLPLIQQPQAVKNGFTAEATSVAVLDTGVNYFHPDFSCNSLNQPKGRCRVIQAFDVAADDQDLDDDGHGTNVAAIIARTAIKTNLIVLDVFTGTDAFDSDILAALNWIVNNAHNFNIKAVNISFGVHKRKYTDSCDNSSYEAAFQQLRNKGVIPVVASGNDGFADGVHSPACVRGAVVVGAVYDQNLGRKSWNNQCTDTTTRADQIACFSNGGKLVNLLAPGAMIFAGGKERGGTSQAAPHVSAAIAILRGNVTPIESLDQTIKRLQRTGTPIRDLRSGLLVPRIDLLKATQGMSIVKNR